MNLLYKAVIENIFSMMSFSEQTAMCVAYPKWNKWKKSILVLISEKMVKLGNQNTNEFFKALKDEKALITGSFLLSLITDDFDFNDLDIVTKFKENDNFLYWMFGDWGQEVSESNDGKQIPNLPIPYDFWNNSRNIQTWQLAEN